jgi:methylphosphotriester-DNA--protein-cysteine methyltransferase
MSDITLLEKQLDDARSDLALAKTENEAIKTKIEEAKDAEFASKISSFESSAIESQSTIAELEETIKSTQARVAELEDALVQSQSDLTEAVQTVADMKEKEKQEVRKASLSEVGLDTEDESVQALFSLEDKAFEAVITMMGNEKKKYAEKEDYPFKDKKKKKEEEDEASKKKASEEAEAEVEVEEATPDFDDVESTEATLIESEEVDVVGSTRASIADWLTNHVLTK